MYVLRDEFTLIQQDSIRLQSQVTNLCITLCQVSRKCVVTDQFLRGCAQFVGAGALCHPVEDVLPDAVVTQMDAGKTNPGPPSRRNCAFY